MAKVNLQRITVGDFLERPYFQKAKIIASPSALKREVTWVHIMDSTNVEHLLNGGELILSTGLGWRDDEELCLYFLRQLIHSNCAGLCIELVAYTKTFPESAIMLAKENDFPVILFYEEVRYIDITQDHYSIFLNYHHKMVTELERLSGILNQSLLSGKDHLSLLKEFSQFTGLSLLFQLKQGEPIHFPAKSINLNKGMEKETRAIKVMNHPIAHLTVYAADGFDEFQRLATDRVEIALAQELMRSMYVEERKSRKEELWLQRWLTEEYKEDDIHQQLQSMYPGETFTSLVICLAHRNNDTTTTMIGNSMITRSLFDDLGLTLITTSFQQQTVYLLLAKTDIPHAHLYENIMGVFDTLKEDKILDTYAVGQLQTKLDKIRFSYESAQVVLHLQERFQTSLSPLYDDLHIHRIIYYMDNNNFLKQYVDEYLHDMIRYDKRKNSQLLRTLKAYLRCNGNKQETANHLFIVRQSLYHRLRKIEDIIGADFFVYQKRLAIEIALLGYEYLYGPLDEKT